MLILLIVLKHFLHRSLIVKSRQTRIDLVTRPPLTQTGEKTALFCLAQHDWKLDLALDNYFANPEGYYKEPKSMIDRKKIETLYTRYRGKPIIALTFVLILHSKVSQVLVISGKIVWTRFLIIIYPRFENAVTT